MQTDIILTGILRDNALVLVVKRNENDSSFPGAWELPGGHLENGELIEEGLKRELKEEIGFDLDSEPIITHYSDMIKENGEKLIHEIEIDFIINVDRKKINVQLSGEHSDYKWVKTNSELLDDFIKDKFSNM